MVGTGTGTFALKSCITRGRVTYVIHVLFPSLLQPEFIDIIKSAEVKKSA